MAAADWRTHSPAELADALRRDLSTVAHTVELPVRALDTVAQRTGAQGAALYLVGQPGEATQVAALGMLRGADAITQLVSELVRNMAGDGDDDDTSVTATGSASARATGDLDAATTTAMPPQGTAGDTRVRPLLTHDEQGVTRMLGALALQSSPLLRGADGAVAGLAALLLEEGHRGVPPIGRRT